jgi:hypothetical protein
MNEDLDSYLIRITEHKKGKSMKTKYVNTLREAKKITHSFLIPEVDKENKKRIINLYWNSGKVVQKEIYNSSFIGDTVFMCVIENKMNG